MMRYISCTVVCLCLSALSYGEDEPQILDPNQNNDVAHSLTEGIKHIFEATQQGRDDLVRSALSRQYLESGKMIQQFLRRQGQDTTGFEKGILGDFRSYSVTTINKIYLYKDIAFIEASIAYSPVFLAKRHKEHDGKPVGECVWWSTGGRLYDMKWENDGKGIATFYCVRQNNMWKLHCVYFASSPLNGKQLKRAETGMKSLVGPNSP